MMRVFTPFLVISTVLSGLPCIAMAVDTFGWRGDGTGAYPDAHPPVLFGEGTNLAWKVELPNWANGSPSLGGPSAGSGRAGHVYALCEPTVAVPAPQLVCLDRRTGAILWQRELGLFDCYDEPELRTQWRQSQANRRQGLAYLMELQALYRRQDAGEEVTADIERVIAEAKAINVTLERGKPVGKGPDKGKATATGKAWFFSRELMKELKQRYGVQPFRWEPRGGNSPLGETGGWASCWVGQTFCAPATDAEHVYAYTGRNVIGCYSHAGEERWKVHIKPPGHKADEQHWASSIYVVGDRLLCYGYNTVFVLDKATGSKLWKHTVTVGKESGVDDRNYTACVPVEVGETTYGLLVWDNVYLFDLNNGRNMLADQGELGKLANGTPGVIGNTICFQSRTEPKGMRAYRLQAEGEDVRAELLWAGPTGPPHGHPIENGLHNGVSILGYAGRFWFGPTLTADTGHFDPRFIIERSHISPIGAGAYIYSGKDDGTFFVYDARTGERLATTALALPTPTGERLARIRGDAVRDQWPHFSLATPIADGPDLFIRANDILYCFRPAITGLPQDDPAVVAAIRKAPSAATIQKYLTSDSSQYRYEALRAIRQHGAADLDPATQKRLHALATDDPDPEVRAEALRLLGVKPDQPGGVILRAQVRAVKRGGQHGNGPVEDPLPVLTARTLGAEADSVLTDLLRSNDAEERRAAALTILAAGDRRTDGVRDALLASLTDPTWRNNRGVMRRTVDALTAVWADDPVVLNTIETALMATLPNQKIDQESRLLGHLLAHRPVERRVPLCQTLAEKADCEHIRVIALQHLRDHLGGAERYTYLNQRFAADASQRVKDTIIDEMARLANTHNPALTWIEQLATAAGSDGVQAVKALKSQITDDERRSPVLLNILASDGAAIPAAIFMMQRDIEGSQAAKRLKALLKAMTPEEREGASRLFLDSFQYIRSPDLAPLAAKLLAGLLADGRERTSANALEGLRRMGPNAVSALPQLKTAKVSEGLTKRLADLIAALEKVEP